VPGTAIVRESDEAAMHIVVSGALRIEARGLPPEVARPGDTVGMYEVLADGRAAATVTPVEAGAALRIEARDLFDLMSDHLDLLQSLFAALLRSTPPELAVESASSFDAGDPCADPQPDSVAGRL